MIFFIGYKLSKEHVLYSPSHIHIPPCSPERGLPSPICGKLPGIALKSTIEDKRKEIKSDTKESVYDASLKSSIGPILSTPKCNFPSFPINLPYPYSHPSVARCLSRISELICAVPAVSPNASLA